METDGGEVSPVTTDPDDIAFWLYSSGSKGLPKGLIHSHSNLSATCPLYAGPILGISQGNVIFSSTKMFHAYGLGNNLSFPSWAGATSVYLTGRPTPIGCWSQSAPIGLAAGSVPALYNVTLADPGFDETDRSSVRPGVSTAEPLPPRSGVSSKPLFSVISSPMSSCSWMTSRER